MSRKREAATPALVLFSIVSDDRIPRKQSIDSPKFLVGRSTAANLKITQRSISREECTFTYDETTKKWTIEAHSKKGISVRGKHLKANDTTTLECGDKIKFTADIIYEFRCSPDENGKCCSDFKKVKLSKTVEEDKNEDFPSVLAVNEEQEISLIQGENVVETDASSVSLIDIPGGIHSEDDTSSFSLINGPGGNDAEHDISLVSLVNVTDRSDNQEQDVPLHNSLVLPSTLPISQLPDSSEFRNPADEFSYSVTEVTESFSYSNSKPVSPLKTDLMPEASSNHEINFPLHIDDLETEIQNYGNDDPLSFDEKFFFDKKVKDELNYRLEYIKKLAELNSSCQTYISDPNDVYALNAIKELSAYFQKECSILDFRNEKTIYNKPNEHLYRIILNMDTLLKEKTRLTMSFLPKFLESSSSSNKEPPKTVGNMQNFLDDDISDYKPQNTHNHDEYEKLVREKNDLLAENEKYKEENKRMKDNVTWQESRLKFLELKVKEKEKLELELETVKEETEMLEKQNADLKRNLANLEIMELEYKNILETNKYREEDKRNKDALQRTISTLESEIKVLKDNNAQLSSDKSLKQDEIAQLTEKCNELEEKVKEKIAVAATKVSACGSGSTGEEFCCDMVREVKASLMELMDREFQCSICGEMLIESTVTNCNHVFCSFCLQEWKKKQKKCPFCRAQLVKEVRATIIDDYITGFLKVMNEEMHSERLKVMRDRTTKKTPTIATAKRGGGRRNSRQPAAIVDLS